MEPRIQHDQAGELGTDPAHRSSGVSVEVAELIRHIGIVGILGASLGLIVGGIGGRVLMRIAAIVAPDNVTGAATETATRSAISPPMGRSSLSSSLAFSSVASGRWHT